MTSLIDYILSLFRSEDAARSFVAAPGRAMTSAGLIDIAPHQISSVAANVVPGLNLGAGDPMSGLRQAVAARHGFAQDVANVGFAGDAGAGVASVITTDVGAGLASGLGAGFLGQGGLALAASSGGFGGQVGLAAQVGLGFTAVIEAEVGAQVGAGLGIGTGLGAQAGMGFGGGVGLGLGGQAGGVIGGSAAGAIGAGVGGRLGGNGQIGVAGQGAVGAGVGANGTFVPIAAAGAACEVRGCNSMSIAYAEVAPRTVPAPRPSTARRLNSGMRAIMPWTFGRIGNAVPL